MQWYMPMTKEVSRYAIDTQFCMDVKGLLPQDKYLITCNRQAVKDMSATGQKTWLNSILIA
jgi:hypothetical protein